MIKLEGITESSNYGTYFTYFEKWINDNELDEVENWCAKNLKSWFRITNSIAMFSDKEDAFKFALMY